MNESKKVNLHSTSLLICMDEISISQKNYTFQKKYYSFTEFQIRYEEISYSNVKNYTF